VVATALVGAGLLFIFLRPEGRSANLTWDYDYAKNPPCRALIHGKRLEYKCVTGFNAFTREGSEHLEQQFIPNRLGPGGQIANKAIRATIPVHRYGHLEFCVSSVGKEVDGRTSESEPVCMKRWVLPLLKD
jgi:hypothetical protein